MEVKPRIIIADHDSAAVLDSPRAAGDFITDALQQCLELGHSPKFGITVLSQEQYESLSNLLITEPLSKIKQVFIPGGGGTNTVKVETDTSKDGTGKPKRGRPPAADRETGTCIKCPARTFPIKPADCYYDENNGRCRECTVRPQK